MAKEILVNSASRETRIAVLDDKHLVELRVEREELVVGNIYKGRVENVLPGMDAAFLDIGLERNAFLYVADILPEYVEGEGEAAKGRGGKSQSNRVEQAPSRSAEFKAPPTNAAVATEVVYEATEAEAIENEESAEAAEREAENAHNESYVGAIEEAEREQEAREEYEHGEDDVAGEQELIAEQEAAVIAEMEELIDADTEEEEPEQSQGRPTQDRRPQRRPIRPRNFRRHIPIQELVSIRQELMLQVVKGPRGTKGSRVSTRMSLPGRYLVLMPDANNLGISRKIDDSKERDRLKKIVEKFRQPGFGIIVRTEAEGRPLTDLFQDYTMLVETWVKVLEKAKITPAPSLIYQDMSLIYTIIRDAFGSDIDKLVLDSPDDYAKAHDIVSRLSPHLAERIHLYDGDKPMFESYKIEDEIERLLRRKVWLRSGGYLVIDQTEALTSIDVNTGKFTGSTGLSETILQTNMEATNEIARQLRLRDIGGMIVLDFIDMDNARDKKSVTDALIRALKFDRSRTKIASISPLGLIEMTRKRTRETVDFAMTETCPYCHGLGRVPSAETVSMQVEREIRKMAKTVNSEALLVLAQADVAAHLIGAQGEDIEKLERQVQRAIFVRVQPHWHVEKFEIEPGTIAKVETAHPLPKPGQILEAAMEKSILSMPPWAASHFNGEYQVDVSNGAKFLGQNARVRITTVGRSLAIGDVITGSGAKAPSGNVGNQPSNRQGRPYRTPAGIV